MKNKYINLKRFIVIFGLIGIVLPGIAKLNIIDLDLFHQLSLFREFIETGEYPHNDVFSYIETKKPSVHHEWGHGALFFLLIRYVGLDYGGLLIIRYFLYATILFGCYLFCRKHKVDLFLFAPIFVIVIPIGFALPVIRAQVFTQLFLLILILLIEKYKNHPRYQILYLVPVFLVWQNFHAGFLVGIGYIVFYLIEKFLDSYRKNKSIPEALRTVQPITVLLVCVSILVFLNPYGYNYLPYLIEAVTLDRTDLIAEWKPLWEVSLVYLFFYLIYLVLIFYSIKTKGIYNLPSLLFVIVLSVLTLKHFKYTTIYCVVLLCYLPVYLNNTNLGNMLSKLSKSFPIIYFVFWIIAGASGISYACYLKFWHVQFPTTMKEFDHDIPLLYPVGAAKYLSMVNFKGNLATHYDNGSYITWKLYPSVKVSMDSRFEVAYSLESFKQNISFFNAEENWKAFLKQYPTDAILVPLWSGLAKVVGEQIEINQPDSKIIYKKSYVDDGFVLYVLEKYDFPFIDWRGRVFYESFHEG